MQFSIRSRFDRPSSSSPEGVYLEADSWDDFGYKTLWALWIVRDDRVHEIGGVKIGHTTDQARPDVPKLFSQLPEGFFSLGQDEEYYDKLNQLDDPSLRQEILTSLRDVALDLALFERVRKLGITDRSLLRWVKPVAVRTQFHRIARGGVKLSPYSFSYSTSRTDRYGHPAEPTGPRL